MSHSHRSSIFFAIISSLVFCALFMTACGAQTPTSTQQNSAATKPLQNVSIGLGYNPDIQFAPFYVALSKGYYRDAGLNVTLNNGIVTDLFGTMATGKNTFVFGGGDEMLTAVNQDKGLQVIDTATIYQEYPVSLIVPADSSIKTLADLKGHTIGVPGPYGATYNGFLALLSSAHLTLKDVKVQYVNFNQVSALLTHKVDAVVGYSNNEPLELQDAGMSVRTFDVSKYVPLVSNGIVTTDTTYQNQQQMVKSFVQATLRGVNEVIANPDEAVTISQNYIPALNTTQAKQILQATLPVYEGNGKLGYNDAASWQATEQFLVNQKIISAPIQNLSQYYTNAMVS
ncbi:MAG TPA: ABC transporter substrate-binding protein [Dictyobacter sp.]|nr:ABC transporter substrate-binding protein [Dictyobacter sp.]